jgi:hypothetical protein
MSYPGGMGGLREDQGPDKPQPQPKAKKRLKVEPEAGGQLEQFLIANKAGHDAAEAAKEAEDTYKAGIKLWLLRLFPPGPDGTPHPDLPDAFDIAADPHGRYPAYTMTLKGVDSFRFNTERAKTERPDIYDYFKTPVTPSWELRESTGGRRRG